DPPCPPSPTRRSSDLNVRLSGQDSSRGTFSHRHAIITDIKTGREHLVLGGLHPEQGLCRIYDSPLSEAGVLGFEFGYSLDYPDRSEEHTSELQSRENL